MSRHYSLRGNRLRHSYVIREFRFKDIARLADPLLKNSFHKRRPAQACPPNRTRRTPVSQGSAAPSHPKTCLPFMVPALSFFILHARSERTPPSIRVYWMEKMSIVPSLKCVTPCWTRLYFGGGVLSACKAVQMKNVVSAFSIALFFPGGLTFFFPFAILNRL